MSSTERPTREQSTHALSEVYRALFAALKRHESERPDRPIPVSLGADYARWLLDAVRRALDGDPDPFGLKPPRGRPATSRPLEIARAVHDLVQSGMSLVGAYREVNKRFGLEAEDHSAAEKYYRDLSPELKWEGQMAEAFDKLNEPYERAIQDSRPSDPDAGK